MSPKKGGAPRKEPGGLRKVLYVRATPEMLSSLDRLAEEKRRADPGQQVSRADVARAILREAMVRGKKESGE